ncbi:MAG: hypothetical protein M1434_08725 [Chloroflexi bacterium]|nr:hypothetical protein [Chloroflexota bacterium]MCL5274813.1 hypothetical protein [Chloroflexota bacterium]
MNKTLQRVIAGAVIAAAAGAILLVGGNVITAVAQGSGPFGWGAGGMMGAYGAAPNAGRGFGGMMGSGRQGGYGMMGGWYTAQGVKPLTVDQTTAAVNGYLASLNNPDLALGEVMIFDNNSYARIVEKSTGRSAFELLVNPATQAVTPEPGPNMMWNAKYSPMSGMMGGFLGAVTTAMPLSASDALKTAQAYLDQYLSGMKTAEDANAFYGYYTIDTLRDGKVAGMLSVNGYTGQVWLHTWHGNFITMSEGR